MNQEIKAKWVAALRSGEYKQGKGRLKIDGSYCCLGVLCDLYRKETGLGEWDVNNYFYTRNSKNDVTLTQDIVKWSELKEANPIVKEIMISMIDPNIGFFSDAKASLSFLNDRGYTFDQIADVIETDF